MLHVDTDWNSSLLRHLVSAIEHRKVCDTQDDVPVFIPDQWSPVNPEGKKRYERDFLMELQNDPQSKKKPDNLPDIEVVLKDNTNRVSCK
jgi:hypothetical protein